MLFRLAGPALGLLLLSNAAAQNVEGVDVPQALMLADDTRLVLNGVGVRRYFLFDVYVGALYLQERAAAPRAIIEEDAPKCIYLHFLRDVRSNTITRNLLKGLRANLGEAAVARLQPRIDRLRRAIPNLKAGDRVHLAFATAERTQAWINGRQIADVPGRDFQQAVLSFWLGERPVDERLKQALLGTDSAPRVAGETWPEDGRP